MRKTFWLLIPLVFVFSQEPGIAGPQSDAELEAKLNQKIEQMKAEGVSQEEIDKFVAGFKKKVAVLKAEHEKQEAVLEKVGALKSELKKKVKKMKAAGTVEKEVNEVIADYEGKIREELEASGAPEEAIKKVIAGYRAEMEKIKNNPS